jgi:Methyltransferase domain
VVPWRAFTMRFGGLFRERPLYQSQAAVRAYRALRAIASKVGFDIVLKTFYSPVPHLDELQSGTFNRVSELSGLDWDLDTQLGFVRERLTEPAAEFRPPKEAPGDTLSYAVENQSYSLLDATVAYGMVRCLRPSRVVELGSGHSTLVTAEAGRRNQAEGSPFQLEVYDPYPSVAIDELPGLSGFHRVQAQQVPLSVFESLDDGDVLFVDTTHVVKIGSDVNFVILEVLPRLREGVVVHIHDVFLPFEYPRRWMEDFALFWNEQYLLQAFLAHNENYEILVGVHALRRLRRKALATALPAATVEHDGGSMWIRRARNL